MCGTSTNYGIVLHDNFNWHLFQCSLNKTKLVGKWRHLLDSLNDIRVLLLKILRLGDFIIQVEEMVLLVKDWLIIDYKTILRMG
jgi:hypothetical protein